MRSGVLVVTAWIEGDDQRLRARVTRKDSVIDLQPESTAMATSVDEVCDIVREWLEGVRAS